jgi:hypothetical protein
MDGGEGEEGKCQTLEALEVPRRKTRLAEKKEKRGDARGA